MITGYDDRTTCDNGGVVLKIKVLCCGANIKELNMTTITERNFQILPWDDRLNIGIPIIDKQHRAIVSLINNVATDYISGFKHIDKNSIFDELTEYVLIHFDTEETIWGRYLTHDALSTEHHHQHLKFIDSVLELKTKLASTTDNPIKDIESIIKFLIQWLIFHILGSDKQLANIVLSMQEGMTLEVAKDRSLVTPIDATGVIVDNILTIYSNLTLAINDLKSEQSEKIELQKSLLMSNGYKEVLISSIHSVAKALELRDPYTAGHQDKIADIAELIGMKLGLDHHTLESLRLGASVHDIGKLAIPTELLVKPKRINEIEYQLIKQHPLYGLDIFKDVDFPWPIKEIIVQHHERIDGSGYPYGLKEKEICLEAKIVSVADIYDAMISHRPYRPALDPELALKELRQHQGQYYDPDAVAALLELVGEGAI